MKRFLTINNIFLFAVIIVLPVCVAYYSINNMIEEQYHATCESVSDELRRQIAEIEYTSKAEYQIKDFLEILIKDKKICRQKPEEIKKFIENLDKIYPGAFKWVFIDENYKLLPIKSKKILEASRYWQYCLKGGIYWYNRFYSGTRPSDYSETMRDYKNYRSVIQRMMGNLYKVEHIFEIRNEANKSSWDDEEEDNETTKNKNLDEAIKSNKDIKEIYNRIFKSNWNYKDCYVIWNVDGISYTDYNTAKEIAGACALMVFPENLPENIWYKRLIVRRQSSKEKYKYPIAAVNITKNESFVLDSTLPNDKEFVKGLIDAYNKRTKELFIYKNYIVGSTVAPQESEIRILSMVNMSDALMKKGYMQLLLIISCLLFVAISIAISFYIKNIRFAIISLRHRIAAIFMLAMILPLLSLISMGSTFISNEENRLKESAFVKMRAGFEALNMRYKDTPRLIESGLNDYIMNLLGTGPYTIEDIGNSMSKAVNEGMIYQFVLVRKDEVATTSWNNIDELMKKTIIYGARKYLDIEDPVINNKNTRNNLMAEAKDAIQDEIEDISSFLSRSEDQFMYNFSRPSHLRHMLYVDMHMYFMGITVVVDNELSLLLIYLSDTIVEKNFAMKEFSANNIAAQEQNNSVIIPELSFYSTYIGTESVHFPAETPIWNKLGDTITRSCELKIEETGIVNIENENYLYLTKPISSMHSQSYQPCLLTSTIPIDSRIRDFIILLVTTSSFAVMGSFLLSFVLSSNLLVPIKKIDSAAQKIGKGNLNVLLPVEGNDELGRLSVTFNEMVRGLRERNRMKAYVSESVLEAVKDNSDQSIRGGKYVEATILFSDIRNFTGISESNEPEVVFKTLNQFFSGVEPIIRMNHGRVDKYIGDAVMAVFHQTIPEHHALSAIKAAVRMKYFVSLMNKDRKEKGLFPIEIGIGISTGHVLLGDVGSHRRKDLTVIGDEVNLASRLETASKQGHYTKIIFSGQTLKFVEDFVEVDKMPFEEIRGKKNAVQIYELINLKNVEL